MVPALHLIAREVLPKSPAAKAVRCALNQWEALTRFLEDGDLEIDNGATERANRDIVIGRGNSTLFGSDNGEKASARRFATRLRLSNDRIVVLTTGDFSLMWIASGNR